MKYYVIATRVSLDGFPESFTVSYDNQATCDFDNFMFFDTTEEAQSWTESPAAKEWKNCKFQICETD